AFRSRRPPSSPRMRLILVWFLAAVFSVLLGKGLFFHYFQPLAFPLCLMFALRVRPIAPNRQVWGLPGVAYVLTCFVAAVPAFGPFWGSDFLYYKKLGEIVRGLTMPQDKIFVWGGNALPLVTSGRDHATSYVSARLIAPPYADAKATGHFQQQ